MQTVHSHALAALSLAAAGFAVYAGFSRDPALVDDPILTVSTDSLTSMQLTAATDKQNVLPIAVQRGSRIEGTLRGRPFQRMAIQGNPYENTWSGTSLNGIRLETGTYDISDVDLALPAEGFPWVVGRTYNNRQDVSGAHISNGPQGKQWFQASMPEIALFDHPTLAQNDIIYLFYGADRFAEYRRASSTATTFRARNGAAGVFTFTSGDNDTPDFYTLYDQNGNVLTFFGFDDDATPAEGQLWTILDPAGNKAYVGHATLWATALSSYTSPEGYIATAYDTSGRRYSYTYANDAGSTKRLTQVKAEINSGGWIEVGRVDYEYYGNEAHGDIGDLKLVEITTPLSDSGVSVTKKKYYRYWDSGGGGAAHDIKLIVDFEGTRAFDWAGDTTFDEDFVGANDVDLQPYASAYFEYDGHKIIEAFFNGECGCSGGSNGTYTISYQNNGSFSGNPGYDEDWKNRVVIEQPEGPYITQYFDEVGQPLSRVITDGDPTGEPEQWVTRVIRDEDGRVESIHTPANLDTYDHSTGDIVSLDSAGLVWTFPREPSDTNSRFGFVSSKEWQIGVTGGSTPVEEYAYEAFSRSLVSGESFVYRPIRNEVVKVADGGGDATTMAPDQSAAALAIEFVVTTNPEVVAAENGLDDPTETTDYFRDDATRSFHLAEDGVATYWEYTNGQLTKMIEDADEIESGDFDDTPPDTNAAAVHRVTTYTYDAQGRRATETQPDLRVFKTYYTKLADGRLVTLHYADYEAGTPRFHGPVEYTVQNHAGKVEVQAIVALGGHSSTTALTGHVDETDSDPIVAMDLGSLVRMTTNLYDEAGTRLEATRLYHDIPASGAGSDGTHYDATLFGYDDMGRQWRVKAPHGTINRTVFDGIGRTIEHWVGKNDYSFVGGDGSGPDDMVKTDEVEFDGGSDNANSYVTERTLFVEGSGTGSRVTSYQYDVRGHVLLETRPTAPHALRKYDNLGRLIATGLYSSTGSITVGTTDPVSSAGGTDGSPNRLGLTELAFDARGQVWKATRHKIDAGDGSKDDTLETLNWYDATGQLIKVDGPQLTKTIYDRLGRQTHQFILAVDKASGGGAETAYGDADDVLFDIVLEEHQTVYESSDSDDVLMRVSISRFHSDFGGGETTGVLDTNADVDSLLVTAGDLKGRADITAFWYDQFGRVTGTARYGTNGGSTFDRIPLSLPGRSDTVLVTENIWGTDGAVQDVKDPKALIARSLYDDAGRTIATIRNWVDNSPSGVNGDDDVFTRYTYLDGLQTEMWVDFDGDAAKDNGVDEVTTYAYGTTKGASAGDSRIATGHLLQKIAYPDSASGSDVASLAYNAQRQEIWRKDQAGNVLESEYDTSARQTKLKATTVIGGFDDAVERIESAYTSLGQVQTVTSYDAPTSGTAVNEVKYVYDGWGNVTSFKQDKDGTVGGSGFYEVAYTWAKETDGRNTVRKSGATLPSGASLTYDYVSLGGRYDDAVSRVSRILHGATNVVQYGYNGVAQLVGTDYRQPAIMWLLSGSSAGSYPDLDNFNRVTSSRWTSDLTTDVDFFDLDIAYDRNSNITRVEDNVHVGFDWSYTMDGLDRLTNAQRGTWSGSITSEKEEQTWALMDQVGNWEHVKLDLNGDGDWGDAGEYDDDRTHNTVNELTARDTDDNGSNNYTLAYDAVGNLTDDGESYEYVYDPFGRLRKVNTQASALVAEYKYNGLGHMIAVHQDTDTDLDVDANDKWFYPVHDERWRMVANFRDSDTAPKEEWVNQDAGLDGRGGGSYIDGVALRNKDANTAWTSASDGSLEERIYLCQNWHGDVSALAYSNGDQVEQVRYSPYGTPLGLPGGDSDSDGDCDGTDVTQIQTWINGSIYNVRADLDLDGDVDATDQSTAQASYQGLTLGRGKLSSWGSKRGWSGYLEAVQPEWHEARTRRASATLGRWDRRDFIGYVDGANLYGLLESSPIVYVDPWGTETGEHYMGPVTPSIGPLGSIGGTIAKAITGITCFANVWNSCEMCDGEIKCLPDSMSGTVGGELSALLGVSIGINISADLDLVSAKGFKYDCPDGGKACCVSALMVVSLSLPVSPAIVGTVEACTDCACAGPATAAPPSPGGQGPPDKGKPATTPPGKIPPGRATPGPGGPSTPGATGPKGSTTPGPQGPKTPSSPQSAYKCHQGVCW